MNIKVSRFATAAALAFCAVPTAQAADPGLNLSTLAIVVTNVPGNPRDWVGIFAHGGPNTSYKDWKYVACDAQAPACAVKKAPAGSTQTVHLNIPASLAQADIRLLSVGPDGAYHVITEIDPDFSTH